MNGTSLYQVLYAQYHTQGVQLAAQQSHAFLTAMTSTVHAMVGLWVLLLGYGLIMGRVDMGEGFGRLIRALIVVALMTPAHFDTLLQWITTDIPEQLSGAVVNGGGGAGVGGAAGFDGLSNYIDSFSARIYAQATGFLYIGDRVMTLIANFIAKSFIFITFCVWLAANSSLLFLAPLGALLAPGILFRATEGYFARWLGKCISLELVAVLALMLATFVVKSDGEFVQKLGNTAAASAATPTLSLNAGSAANFTGFDVPGGAPVALGAPQPGGGGSTLNVPMSIAALFNLALSFAVGAMLLVLLTGIALFIGGSHGFSAGPAINAVTTSASMAAAGTGRAAGAAGRALR